MISRVKNGRRLGEMALIKISAHGHPSQSFCSFDLLLLPDTYSGLIGELNPIQTNTQTTTQQRSHPKPRRWVIQH